MSAENILKESLSEAANEVRVSLVNEERRRAAVPVARKSRSAAAIALRLAFAVLNEILRGPRLIREVGPNERPLERHEFENPEYRNQYGRIL